MAAYATALLFAIPGFSILMCIEILYGHLKGNQTLRVLDTISSLSSGITNIIKDSLGLVVLLISYPFLLEHISVTKLPSVWWTFLIGFIAKDFAAYWNHRLNHTVNVFWNRHVIHHSSEEFNLPCALRQSISVFFGFLALFLFPAALLGVPYKVIAVIAPIHLFLQFWYHTKHIGKLGWLEYIIVTPSQHRVHHAINPEYIDKNFSAIFCVWDRMFGTFQEELDAIPPVYGVLSPPRTWNPIKINFQHFFKLLKDAWRTKSWKEKCTLWFKQTGYRPTDVHDQPWLSIDDVYAYEKYDTPASTGFKIWSCMQLLMTVSLLMWMFYRFEAIRLEHPLLLYLYGGVLFVGIYGWTSLMDGDTIAPWVETFRSSVGLAILWFTKGWFGAEHLVSMVPYGVAGYFLLTIVGSWYFYIVEQKEWREVRQSSGH